MAASVTGPSYHEYTASNLRFAAAVIDRGGTGAVSLSAAARGVGISPQASYNHSSSRPAAFSRCWARSARLS
jgi:hypothetical protein